MRKLAMVLVVVFLLSLISTFTFAEGPCGREWGSPPPESPQGWWEGRLYNVKMVWKGTPYIFSYENNKLVMCTYNLRDVGNTSGVSDEEVYTAALLAASQQFGPPDDCKNGNCFWDGGSFVALLRRDAMTFSTAWGAYVKK